MTSVMERPREFGMNAYANAPMRFPTASKAVTAAAPPSSPCAAIAYQGPYGSVPLDTAAAANNTVVLTAPPAFQEAAAAENSRSYSGPYHAEESLGLPPAAPGTAYQGRYNHSDTSPAVHIRSSSSGLIAAELAPAGSGSPCLSGPLDRAASHDSVHEAPVYHGRLNRCMRA